MSHLNSSNNATPKKSASVVSETVLLLTNITENLDKSNSEIVYCEQNQQIYDELKDLILQGNSEDLNSKLVEHVDFPINTQSKDDGNYALLHHAARKKSVDCLRVLLEFSANPNISTTNGWTPPHVLVNSGCHCTTCEDQTVKCLQILADHGGYMDAEDNLGETPLYEAGRNRLSQVVEFLLTNGANINHWVDGTSVATILAQYVPDALKAEFDKRISPHGDDGKGKPMGVRLDFRLLIQEVATHGGFGKSLPSSRKKAAASNPGRNKSRDNTRKRRDIEIVTSSSSSGRLSPTSSVSACSSNVLPPRETELLNYLLRADLASIETVVNHPLVEAFVHLKWLSVRRLFFLFRSVYLLLMSVYTLYVFDAYVNAPCHVKGSAGENVDQNDTSTSGVMSAGGNLTSTVLLPTAREKRWETFSEYFKAQEMTCEFATRTTALACLLAGYAAAGILYELCKMCESWYDYVRTPLNLAWWILNVNIAITVVPGLGLWAHKWLYPYAAVSLVYGWMLMLAQIGRIPYFGIIVGIFSEVLKDFSLLLLTFSPVLLAFAVGFAVMLPQNEFFRSIPLGVFKVFLMMSGDVDFWGIFRHTWAVVGINHQQGYVYIPLFVIYTSCILVVTMVLMSLLLGLAVNDIQEIRREAALRRTVRVIQEIGIFEAFLQTPILAHSGCSRYLTSLFSITSLPGMNGPELVTYPEDPEDQTLTPEIKQKLLPYLKSSCHIFGHNHQRIAKHSEESLKKRKRERLSELENSKKVRNRLKDWKDVENGQGESSKKFNKIRRNTSDTTYYAMSERDVELSREVLNRDIQLYHDVAKLLEDNDKLRSALEVLRGKLIRRK